MEIVLFTCWKAFKKQTKKETKKKKTQHLLGPPDILSCPIMSKIGGGFSCIV